jgi:Asp-tRNA(Asn)/Glu-tRNA(Gln) amidotransferase A subunit family amidase
MAPFALGTQTMGSVIRPASFCGVFGFKPSFGAIPRTGIMADAPSLDHVGVFARTLADLTLAQHLMGGDGSDPDSGIDPGPLDATAMAEPPLRPVLAFTGTAAWERAEAATREAFVELAEAIGGPVDQIPLPGEYERALDDTMTLMSAEMAHELGGYVERGREKLHPGFVELIEAGRKVPAVDYLEARRWQGRLRAGLDRVFDRYDAIITPAAPGEAPGAETTGDASFCALWSLTGLPAVNLPLMTGPAGLPLGVQLVGRHGDDARLLRTANWLVRHLGFDGETE